MQVNSDHLLSRDGLRLFYRSWLPDNCKKIICLIHGHGEHSGRYNEFAEFLCLNAIGVFAMDLRGHGLSKGKKGHARSGESLYYDIEELLKIARAAYLDIPIYLFGHSMGGNLVANFMIRMDSKEVSGFMLSAPWFKLNFDPPKWKKVMGDVMAHYWPRFSAPSGLSAHHISSIPDEVKRYQTDPLIHDRISAGLFSLIRKGGLNALKKSKKIKKPGLIYHGTRDQIVDFEATKTFALSNQHFEWHPIEGAYHEPHHDLQMEEVMKLVRDWVIKN